MTPLKPSSVDFPGWGRSGSWSIGVHGTPGVALREGAFGRGRRGCMAFLGRRRLT